MTERETQSIAEIEITDLLAEIDALRLDNWRLVQILCISSPEGAELTYSFGGGMAMQSLRVKVPASDPVPSITAFYPAAFLYENEIRDLFGVRIERIDADWEGRIYDVTGGDMDRKPFSKVSVQVTSSEEPRR